MRQADCDEDLCPSPSTQATSHNTQQSNLAVPFSSPSSSRFPPAGPSFSFSPPASPTLSTPDDVLADASDAEDDDPYDYRILDGLGLPRFRPPEGTFLGDMDDWESEREGTRPEEPSQVDPNRGADQEEGRDEEDGEMSNGGMNRSAAEPRQAGQAGDASRSSKDDGRWQPLSSGCAYSDDAIESGQEELAIIEEQQRSSSLR